MTIPTTTKRRNDLQTLFEVGAIGSRSDGQLLEQLQNHGGRSADAAFRVLVERHGPMVLRVCRAILDDEHDAQDAFQATFLVLIRKAKTIQNQASVGSWLHGVARRVASRARVEASRRHTHEKRVAGLKHPRETTSRGVGFENEGETILKALDEEIGRLPDKYRAPVVLCYLEGLTQEHAAEHLGWPSGTVRGRLARARDLLKTRLSRRGLVSPASLVAASGILGSQLASASACPVPKCLISSTVQASMVILATKKGSSMWMLASSVGRALAWSKIGLTGTAVLGLGIVATGAGMSVLGTRSAFIENATPKPRVVEAKPKPARPPIDTRPMRFPSALSVHIQTPKIDGDLSDWPSESLVWREINTVYPTEREVTGFSARFASAYNLEDQRIYLAVEVTDDKLVTGHKSWHTDAVEVFVEATQAVGRDRRPEDFHFGDGAANWPMLQYSGVPAEGKAYTDRFGLNPTLNDGDCRKTRTEMKYRTVGDVTTYEWAVEVFDRYPDIPARLEPGKHLGFDLAVVDQDEFPNLAGQENTVHPWICWGPYPTPGFKGFNIENIGELILTDAP